jgi:hypothetical protein
VTASPAQLQQIQNLVGSGATQGGVANGVPTLATGGSGGGRATAGG